MTLKELHGALGIWQEIEALKEKIQKTEDLKGKITASYSLAPGKSGDGQSMAKLIETIYQYELELLDKYTELLQKKIELERFFNTVDDPIIRLSLELKYDPDEGKFLSWQQVANKIYGKGASGEVVRKACVRYLNRKII